MLDTAQPILNRVPNFCGKPQVTTCQCLVKTFNIVSKQYLSTTKANLLSFLNNRLRVVLITDVRADC